MVFVRRNRFDLAVRRDELMYWKFVLLGVACYLVAWIVLKYINLPFVVPVWIPMSVTVVAFVYHLTEVIRARRTRRGRSRDEQP